MTMVPKLVHKLKALSIKTQLFFVKNWQDDPKIHTKIQETQNIQNNLGKKPTKLENSYFPISKLTTKPQ